MESSRVGPRAEGSSAPADAGGSGISPPRRTGALRSYGWLMAPAAAGILLRSHGLPDLIAGGDELHAVRAALTIPFERILVTYRPSDNCIPLSAFYRALMALGLQVSELHLRLPVFLSGALALIVLPLWAAARVGRSTAAALAWLMAVSPVLIHYSRMIRSYMPILLFGGGAIIAFDHWRRTGSRRSAALYVGLGALAAYFHLGAVPFILSPFLFFAGARLLKSSAVVPSWRAGIVLGAAISGAFLVFLVPARESLITLIQLKKEPLQVSLDTLRGVAALQSGSSAAPVVTVFWLLAAVGLVTLWRRRPAFAVYGLVLVIGQFVGLLILSPKAMHQAPIFNRYLLICAPIVLLWVAAGVALPWSARAAERWLRGAAAVALLAALVLTGPLTGREFRESPFAVRPEALLFYANRPERQVPLPAVYRELDPDRPGPIIEYPWHTTWRYFSRVLVRYQKDHGRHVIVAPGERLLWDRRLGFRNMVTPQIEPILESRAAYLVWHLDPAAEDRALDRRRKPAPGSAAARDLELKDAELEKLGHQATVRAKNFIERWGPPDHRSERILIWDLDRLRSELGR